MIAHVKAHLSRHWRRYASAIGAGSTVLAVLVLLPIPGLSGAVSVRFLSPVVVGLFGVVAVVLGRRMLVTLPPPVRRDSPRDWSPQASIPIGSDVERSLTSLETANMQSFRYDTFAARQDLRSELQAVVVDALLARGVDPWSAREQVRTGAWTADPRAATFLGEDAPQPPLRLRVIDWAHGVGQRRQAEHAITAVAALVTAEGDE